MKSISDILQDLKETTLYADIKKFSDRPGLYAIHFMGNAFPVYSLKPSTNEIIYVGKTEKSQDSRDAHTHFATGKTGSSTVRRSIGALMLKGAQLKPIPRSITEKSDKRFTNYMFDEPGEILITDWMSKNLGLSFYEFEGSKIELDELETLVIQALKPMLNIDRKNIENPHYDTIRQLRAICVAKAKENKHHKIENHPTQASTNWSFQSTTNTKGLYMDIWKKVLPYIRESLEKSENISAQFKNPEFDVVGNRQSYSFRLDLFNGVAQNNLKGSAVARDLYATLSESNEIMKLLSKKRVVFRLSNHFAFSMTIM